MMIEEDIEHPNFNLTGALEKDNEIRFAEKPFARKLFAEKESGL